jgi:hypothetical protein
MLAPANPVGADGVPSYPLCILQLFQLQVVLVNPDGTDGVSAPCIPFANPHVSAAAFPCQPRQCRWGPLSGNSLLELIAAAAATFGPRWHQRGICAPYALRAGTSLDCFL